VGLALLASGSAFLVCGGGGGHDFLLFTMILLLKMFVPLLTFAKSGD
jgi:hypothetical protein